MFIIKNRRGKAISAFSAAVLFYYFLVAGTSLPGVAFFSVTRRHFENLGGGYVNVVFAIPQANGSVGNCLDWAWMLSFGILNWGLAKFCQRAHTCAMSTMNISLPDSLKSFVDEQVSQRGYGTSSEYVRELIRKDQDRLQLRNLMLAGAASAPAAPADAGSFEGLRDRVRKAAAKA